MADKKDDIDKAFARMATHDEAPQTVRGVAPPAAGSFAPVENFSGSAFMGGRVVAEPPKPKAPNRPRPPSGSR